MTASVENIPRVTEFINAELAALGCGVKAQRQIDIAIDELFGNIAQYAYAPGTGEATVRFAYDPQSGMAEITFMDRGIPYNPLEREDPDISLAAGERGVGGLGIFLVKKTMDALDYRRDGGMNILRIRKKLTD